MLPNSDVDEEDANLKNIQLGTIFMVGFGLETCMQVRKFNLEHTCLPVTENKTLTSTWMSKHYNHRFRNYPNLKAADFRKEMSFKLGQNISRWQAWRARNDALKEIFGDENAQYGKIWDFCTEVMETNPGTKCYVKTIENDEGKSVFQRWYMCWAACREGFHKGCRRLIGVDGCHLKGKFGGQLLVAVALDPNNNIFPLAYAVVEVENKSSWEWFLEHLVGDIRASNVDEADDYEWTFMSDKQKGLIEAFNTVLPKVDHRFCVRHLHENFKRAGFKGLNLKIGLWTAATATTQQYFKLAMAKLKRLDESAYEWLAEKPPEQWCRAYFTTANKCDVLLNNMCEVFNSFILDARDKPILTLISMVKDMIMARMQHNREKAEKWQDKICPKPRMKLLEAVKEASSCMPLKSDRYHFQVFTGSSNNQCAVDLDKRVCTCRKWQLSGIPCKHACAAIRFNGDNVDDWVDKCYYVETYKQVYKPAIKPMSGQDLWPETERIAPLPPDVANKKVGRPKRMRKGNPFEVDEGGTKVACKARRYLCSFCKEEGHNVISCKKKTYVPEGMREGVQDESLVNQEAMPESLVEPNQGGVSSPRQNQGENPHGRATKSKLRRVVGSRTNINFVPTQPGGVSIRAPPPMVGNLLQDRAPFRPPGRTIQNQQLIRDAGQKYAMMKDLHEL